jgi:hypothetical protein
MRLDAEDERLEDEAQTYPSTANSAPAVQPPVEGDENHDSHATTPSEAEAHDE